ncbi:AAA family ATPase [Microbacterium sp. SLBN-146]|uniref:AAA family ATPase n=1 Tax=Microbacterium sp. SLBN-146 TaxID=2768457 RepID=UPI0013579182|nr:AAA family ATPase [Microbacterium sp. SLBN-146]
MSAVLAEDWTPAMKAQMIGASSLPVDEMKSVMQGVLDRAATGNTGATEDMEEQVEATLFTMKVKAEAERRLGAELFTGSAELSWDDLDSAHREFIIPGLLTSGGVCVICARSNLGKTYTYLDMACRMACGMPWLGKPTRQAKTLIVLGEGKAGFMSRLQAWMTAHGKTPGDLRPWLFFIDRANLNNDESLSRIREVVEREGIEVVIYDTWAATSGIQKEDDAVLTGMTINRVKDALPEATHLFIHHPRKAEQDTDAPVMRGSGAFEGAADVVMMMYRDRKFIPASGESFEFIALSTEQDHNGKARDGATETIRGLYLDEIELADGSINRVMRLLDSETISKEAREVRRVLTRPMSHAEYAEASGKSRSTAHRYLQAAVADGVVTKAQGPLGMDIYTPTQAWSELLGRAA